MAHSGVAFATLIVGVHAVYLSRHRSHPLLRLCSENTYVESPRRKENERPTSPPVPPDTRVKVVGAIVVATLSLVTAVVAAGFCGGCGKVKSPQPPDDADFVQMKVAPTLPTANSTPYSDVHRGTATTA